LEIFAKKIISKNWKKRNHRWGDYFYLQVCECVVIFSSILWCSWCYLPFNWNLKVKTNRCPNFIKKNIITKIGMQLQKQF
jgi:hypothetical protein